ncbi:SDR family NAD(P)-dependent oxidoreductase [Mucilaginibacter ginkgonis]|uniref:SDR family oxidoreductase n=1 Tax=Mucilaginibacter ginkgonis TaxID=2682091 RepID=A0A6I4HXP2_9SPHI|nr:SDR family oxidoreductase [Mucilaginibacter ginkgonis]QQL48253.1 SDR family oxidoreductase [Mucilaginibacter ginkgonis]
MNLQLKDKTALVTGSTAGIGYSIAKQLAQEGAIVTVTGRTQKRVDEAVNSIKKETGNENVAGITVDFSNAEDINNLTEQLTEVDILINNVAIFEPKEFKAITDDDWFNFFNVNVMSGVRLSRVYFDKMIAKNWGRIIFIASESALNIPKEMIHYGVTKTAMLGLSRGLAELTKNTNVTVNTVMPGPTLSEGVGGFIEKIARDKNQTVEEVEKDFFVSMRPTSIIQRFLTTDEIANTVTYLASPLSAATNGAAIRAEGGLLTTAV